MAQPRPNSYYTGLAANYSRLGLVDAATGDQLLEQAEQWIAAKDASLSAVDGIYMPELIESDNHQ